MDRPREACRPYAAAARPVLAVRWRHGATVDGKKGVASMRGLISTFVYPLPTGYIYQLKFSKIC